MEPPGQANGSVAGTPCLAILEGLRDGLILLDGHGRVLWLNPSMRELAQLSDGFAVPCDPRKPGACPDVLSAIVAPGGEVAGPFELCVTLPSGVGAAFRVTPTNLEAPHDGTLLAVCDTTIERQSHQEVYRSVAEVAHELRTPLQHILGFVGLLHDIPDLSDDQRQELLEQIQSESLALSLMLDDLLQWGRLGQGRFGIRSVATQLDRLVASTLAKFRLQAENAGLSLNVSLQHDVWAQTDPLRLEQVLANVLSNALHFVPRGGSVGVKLVLAGSLAVISIADTGPGMSSEVLRRLFAPFYQGDESGAPSAGAGLGLSISMQIMRALGGNIRVESRLGAGSTFYIELPCSPG